MNFGIYQPQGLPQGLIPASAAGMPMVGMQGVQGIPSQLLGQQIMAGRGILAAPGSAPGQYRAQSMQGLTTLAYQPSMVGRGMGLMAIPGRAPGIPGRPALPRQPTAGFMAIGTPPTVVTPQPDVTRAALMTGIAYRKAVLTRASAAAAASNAVRNPIIRTTTAMEVKARNSPSSAAKTTSEKTVDTETKSGEVNQTTETESGEVNQAGSSANMEEGNQPGNASVDGEATPASPTAAQENATEGDLPSDRTTNESPENMEDVMMNAIAENPLLLNHFHDSQMSGLVGMDPLMLSAMNANHLGLGSLHPMSLIDDKNLSDVVMANVSMATSSPVNRGSPHRSTPSKRKRRSSLPTLGGLTLRSRKEINDRTKKFHEKRMELIEEQIKAAKREQELADTKKQESTALFLLQKELVMKQIKLVSKRLGENVDEQQNFLELEENVDEIQDCAPICSAPEVGVITDAPVNVDPIISEAGSSVMELDTPSKPPVSELDGTPMDGDGEMLTL